MKFIMLQNALAKMAENAKDALKLVGELKGNPRTDLAGLESLRETVEDVLSRLEKALPDDVLHAVQTEVGKLSLPQFGWCGECGAEWVSRGSLNKEPAAKCKVCKADISCRVMEKPENPPKKDFKANPLMDFLDLMEK